MMHNIDEAISQITTTLRDIEKDAFDYARENLLDDSKGLAQYLFNDGGAWTISVGGIDWKQEDGDGPLTVYVQDLEGDGTLHKFDPIGFIIEMHVPNGGMDDDNADAPGFPISDREREEIQRAITALQSGIDRLKAYEARRIKAQS